MMSEEPIMTNVWAIHSDTDGRPLLRGWAHGESAARQKLEEIKSGDGVQDARYWVSQLEQNQLEALKGSGILPPDA